MREVFRIEVPALRPDASWHSFVFLNICKSAGHGLRCAQHPEERVPRRVRRFTCIFIRRFTCTFMAMLSWGSRLPIASHTLRGDPSLQARGRIVALSPRQEPHGWSLSLRPFELSRAVSPRREEAHTHGPHHLHPGPSTLVLHSLSPASTSGSTCASKSAPMTTARGSGAQFRG